LAGERPLLMAEIGLDSLQHGEEAQAEALRQQIRVTIEGGCAGSFVFSWTDEWHRGGLDIRDWQFGLTRRDRSAKPALLAAATTFSTESGGPAWPRISVVVCVYNGEKQIAECLSALEGVDYPDYEVIVVDDGSTDSTAAIAGRFPVRLISTENRGLSAARNVGLSSATGAIIAYIDGDAYPEPEWLKRLAMVFLKTDYIGVGGPNIPPPSDPPVAQCVARAPGGPIHVLISDTEAEHIPGCNMAFRRAALLEICGFDAQFRVAGDDVDICWRLQERGWKLGFSPTAVVFHHRRDSLRAYWKQQAGYGKAEAMLERKYPAKYNGTGHLTWAGRIYNAKGLTPLFWRRGRIYHGTLGMAPFQLLYQPASGFLAELGLIPEWYLVIAFLAALAVVGVIFNLPIWIDLLFVPALACSIAQAIMSARIAAATLAARARMTRMKYFGILAVLHLLQPLARLYGRLGSGLHPWRVSGGSGITFPRPRTIELWSGTWKAPQEWLSRLQSHILNDGVAAVIGGDYDKWDLQIRRGILASARTKIVVEEHGDGRQMLRFRLWPHCTLTGLGTTGLLGGMALAAAVEHAWPAVALLAGIGLLILGRIMHECALASEKLMQAIRLFADPDVIQPHSSKVIAAGAGGEGC
jgi:glycosyltransferase involved in cell wall biosynthesis